MKDGNHRVCEAGIVCVECLVMRGEAVNAWEEVKLRRNRENGGR